MIISISYFPFVKKNKDSENDPNKKQAIFLSTG